MKRKLLFLFLFINLTSRGQDTLTYTATNISGSRFTQMVELGNMVALLSENGEVRLVDLETLEVKLVNDSCRLIAADYSGRLWMVDSSYYIYTLTDSGREFSNKWIRGQINAIVFDQNNEPIFSTNWGVYIPAQKTYFGSNEIFGPPGIDQIPAPRLISLVNDRELWLIYRMHHFVSGLIFDLKEKKYTRFRDRNIYPLNVTGLIPVEHGLLLLNSHMGIAEIEYAFQDSAYRLYMNPIHPERGPKPEDEEALGAGYYDKKNKYLYYYSSSGLKRAYFDEKNKRLEDIRTIFPANNDYRNNYPEEYINRKKQDFAEGVISVYVQDNIIVFFHREYGLFVFKDGKLKNFR